MSAAVGAGVEPALMPDLPMVDPHVHMWDKGGFDYFAAELLADIHDGHRVEKTIYVECHMGYDDGPSEPLRAVGETRYVLDLLRTAPRTDHALAAGILGCADLTLGDAVRPVLEAHRAAAGQRFRGLRAHVARHRHPQVGYPDLPRYPKTDVLRTDAFLAGVRCLHGMGLALDVFALHTQLDDIAELARKAPEVPIMIDHCGGPIGVGPYADQPEAAFAEWSAAIRRAAVVPNLHVKLSGLGMARLGWSGPPATSSDELAARWAPHVRTCMEAFGPQRAVFASNFPVDRAAGSYRVVLNAYKKLLADLSEADRRAVFHDNALCFYGI